MCKFLNGWTIDLSKIPAYPVFKTRFFEKIDQPLAALILECDDDRISKESRDEFRKLLACVNTKTGVLPVKYSNRHGLGRFYPEVPREFHDNGNANKNFGEIYSGLITMPRIIKNTLFQYDNWTDIDQKKGHPNMLYSVATNNNVQVPGIADYLADGRFDEYVTILSAFYSADPKNPLKKKHIKALFNRTIYGGMFKGWVEECEEGKMKSMVDTTVWTTEPVKMKNKDKQHKLYKAFFEDVKQLTNIVYMSNKGIQEIVCKDLIINEADSKEVQKSVEHSRKSRTMAYWCGIIENEITHQALCFAAKNGLAMRNRVSWGYDGFTNPPTGEDSIANHIDALNAYVVKMTKLPTVQFVTKPFEEEDLLLEVLEAREQLTEEAETPVVVVEKEKKPVDEAMKAAYQEWKAEFELTWAKVTSKSCYLGTITNEDGEFHSFQLKSRSELLTAFEHMTVYGADGEKLLCIHHWVTDPAMRCFSDMGCYPPPCKVPKGHCNIWTESPYADYQSSGEDVSEGVKMFLDHLHVLCNHEEAVYEYMLNWLAHSFQLPGIKKQPMITLISEEGAGKTAVVQYMKAILGFKKVLESTNPEQEVWGNFNELMMSAFLVVLSETDKRNSSGSDGKIKALITDPTLNINPKGKAAFIMQSYHRFIMCTNNIDPVKTHKHDRRNVIIRASDEKIGDRAYFTKLHDNIENKEIIAGIYRFFMERDLEGVNLTELPRTEYHTMMIDANEPPFVQFMKQLTYDNAKAEFVDLSGADLLAKYQAWSTKHGFQFGDKTNSAALVKQVVADSKLKACTTELPRTAKANKRRYNISALKKLYNIHQDQDCGFTEEDETDSDAESVLEEEEEQEIPKYCLVKQVPTPTPAPFFQPKPVPAPVVQPKPAPVIAQPMKHFDACPDNVPHLAVWTATHGHGDKVQWGATTLSVHLTAAKKRNLSDGKTTFIPRLGDAENHLTTAPDQITPVAQPNPVELPVPTKKAKYTRPTASPVCMFEDEE